MNQNWIVENLNNAFSTWNGKLTELWGLVTTSPQTFKGGAVWGVMQSLHNAMIGIGYALIVLFFAISLFKNTANFHELKRPEAAVHYLIRFVAAKTLVGYGIQSLGDQLRPIAMMSLLEFINMQVMTNRRKDATAATWIYFDEIHVLLKDPMSSNFLYSSWKRFRKYNAYATGISQDIQDYLDNPVAYALLSNSEFVIMLRQSKSLEALERLYGLSKPQLEFLRNASEGHGIIKMGNSMIPFSNLEPKDTAVYKLITTKPGEATAEK